MPRPHRSTEYVDRPLAYDPATGRILFADGGLTMAGGDWLATPTPEAVVSMVDDYAAFQHATIGREREAEAAGLPAWDPADATNEAERQAAILHALPTSDPRHITAAQRDRLLACLDALAESGAALADSSVPFCVDHGDLWPGNVLLARSGGHHRFIDFGDAAWTHPFLSLLPLLRHCHSGWSLPASFAESLEHPLLRLVSDAYLQAWTGYAGPEELRNILGHALRIAPLRRIKAIITNVVHATSADADDLGPTPWSWWGFSSS